MTAEQFGFDVEFGRRLAMRRNAHDVSQRMLASRLAEKGMTLDSAALSRIETGQRAPKLAEAVAIAEALNIPLQELVPAKPEATEMARARQGALKQIDDALYKLTGAAGQLEYFASLVEADPETARQLFRDEGPTWEYAWESWFRWAIDSLATEPHRRVVSASDERAHALKRLLGELAQAVVVAPVDYRESEFAPEASDG